MRLYWTVILSFVFFSSTTYKGNKQNEELSTFECDNVLNRIKNAYSKIKCYELKYVSNYYNHENDSLVRYCDSGFQKKFKNEEFISYNGQVVFRDSERFIVIDTVHKTLIVSPSGNKEEITFLNLKYPVSSSTIQNKNRNSNLILNFNNGDLKQIEIEFNNKNYLLSKITLFYKKPSDFIDTKFKGVRPKIEIKYTLPEKRKEVKQIVTDMKVFRKDKQGNLIKTNRYNEYKVINNY
ncbi:MAG: hypothetical protein M0R38_09710 [Bacteroidia bacterium]|nr:hypothetical protein [Bacteroidia bacterium]